MTTTDKLMALADDYAEAMSDYYAATIYETWHSKEKIREFSDARDDAREVVRSEIDALVRDSERWKFVQENIHFLPYDDNGCGPEFDLSNEAIDAAMKGTPWQNLNN